MWLSKFIERATTNRTISLLNEMANEIAHRNNLLLIKTKQKIIKSLSFYNRYIKKCL